MNCDGKTPRARFRVVRLPPGATGATLEAMFGMSTARLLLGRDAPDTELLARTVGADYVTRAPDSIEPPITWLAARAAMNEGPT